MRGERKKGEDEMKIKLAMLEKDQNYLNRIVAVFSTKYAEKIEVYSFTDQSIAMEALESSRIDVLVAGDAFEIDIEKLPKRCGFAYFVDSPDVDMVNEQRAICKFQKVDLIYKQILSIYSENTNNVAGLKLDDDSTKLIIFSSPAGGTGTSSVAAAYAAHLAMQRKRVLYLNLEQFGSADAFFDADGMFDMSDIIYALKSKKANLSMKLESCVKQNEKGVHFYSQPKVALDMLELSQEDVSRLISELKITGSYDYIVIDMDFDMSRDTIGVYKQGHAVIWVGDGTELSNTKIQRAYHAISIIEQNADASLLNRLGLIYNKFSNKTGKTVGDIGIRNIGGAPAYVHASTKQVIEQLAAMEMFDRII